MLDFDTYTKASDRIRRGRERHGDADVCDAWDAQQLARVDNAQPRNVRDLPMARALWEADAAEGRF